MIEKFYKDTYKVKVKMVARILGGDYSAAEDIVQESFIKAMNGINSYDHKKGTINAWFNGILFNTLRDWKRQNSSIISLSFKDVSVEDLLFEDLEFYNGETGVFLEKIFSKVPREVHKKILILYFVLGYTSKEISEILNVSQTNVTTIAARFREKLRND